MADSEPEFRVAGGQETLDRMAAINAARRETGLRYVPDSIRDPDAESVWRPDPIENAYEFAVVGHLRGWCHNGAVCAICVAQLETHRTIMRINEIIGG